MANKPYEWHDSRSTNVVVHGVLEGVDLEAEVFGLFAGGGGLPPLAVQIVEIRRLGRPRISAGRPRPILIRFGDADTRRAAFLYSKRL